MPMRSVKCFKRMSKLPIYIFSIQNNLCVYKKQDSHCRLSCFSLSAVLITGTILIVVLVVVLIAILIRRLVVLGVILIGISAILVLHMISSWFSIFGYAVSIVSPGF